MLHQTAARPTKHDCILRQNDLNQFEYAYSTSCPYEPIFSDRQIRSFCDVFNTLLTLSLNYRHYEVVLHVFWIGLLFKHESHAAWLLLWTYLWDRIRSLMKRKVLLLSVIPAYKARGYPLDLRVHLKCEYLLLWVWASWSHSCLKDHTHSCGMDWSSAKSYWQRHVYHMKTGRPWIDCFARIFDQDHEHQILDFNLLLCMDLAPIFK